MKIQLNGWKVKELSLNPLTQHTEVETDNNFNISFGSDLSTDNSHEFFIGFKVELRSEEFEIKVEFVFSFTTDSEITDEFRNSNFLSVNAPAIAFPYIRSYISNLTLQSGYNPVILPSINFVSLHDNS